MIAKTSVWCFPQRTDLDIDILILTGGEILKKVTKKAGVSCCSVSFTTAQCCSKSSKIVAGCHN